MNTNTLIVDVVATVLIVAYAIYFYWQMEENDKSQPLTFTYNQIMKELRDPWSIIYMFIYLAVIYGTIHVAGIQRINGKYPTSVRFLEYKSWGFLGLIVVYHLYVIVLSFY